MNKTTKLFFSLLTFSIPLVIYAETITVESDLDIDQLVKAAQSELNQPRVSDHPAPFIAELSQNAKDAIPTLLYSSHSHGGGVEAFVVLNGKELRQGDNVGAGVKVEEILEDSVVLSFRGDEFRLRALNSWVNL